MNENDVTGFSGKKILGINSGSSSLKFAFHAEEEGVELCLAEGAVERIGSGEGRLWIQRDEDPATRTEDRGCFADHSAAMDAVLGGLEKMKLPRPDAVGHRVVHGGTELFKPVLINECISRQLAEAVPLAPLHNPSALSGIRAVGEVLSGVPQVACFDTGFFHDLPERSKRLPVSRKWHESGIRRYGFHGISYEYICESYAETLGERTVIAHLGNGSSLTAIRDGSPVDTTMAFTPLAGCMMGTRPGDLDPGVLLYLIQQRGMSPADVSRMLHHESGLRGVSELSRDMRVLLDAGDENEAAALAVEMYCTSVRKHIGALATVLGGVDMLVFTAGIGEHEAPIREKICEGLEFLGVQLDAAENEANAEVISSLESECEVLVAPTNEMLMIARHAARVVGRG